MAPTRIPLIWGTMTMGEPGKNTVRIPELKDCQDVIDVFYKYGHRELDTARQYGEGTTEEYLSKLDLKDCTIDTKVYPVEPSWHAPAKLREVFNQSLKALGRKKVRVLYLHAPDRSVPFEDTCREMNEMYNEGLFEIFGLSNFAAWEVAEVAVICSKNGWVMPKIYQAMYNAITRSMESELVPCCRKFGLRIVIYNPLAGGLFAGKITSINDKPEPGSRFDGETHKSGGMYRNRYFKDGFFQAIKLIKDVANKHNLRTTEIALRWVQHHSVLTPEDGIILGASSVAQLEQNCKDSALGPLPEEVIKALDQAYRIVGMDVPSYWR